MYLVWSLNFYFYDPKHIFSHLRKCDSWLLIWTQIFFKIKRQPFLIRLNLESSHTPTTTQTSWRVCQIKAKSTYILHFTTCKNHSSLCLTTERYKSHDHKNVILKKKHMDLTAHCTADSKVMTRRLVSRFNFSFFCRGPVSSCWAILKTKESSDGFWSLEESLG